MPTKTKESYDISLKLQVSKAVVDTGLRACDVAREYGISDKLVSRWSSEYRLGKSWARSETNKAEDESIIRLEKENRRLKQENEILKKASAYFARNLR